MFDKLTLKKRLILTFAAILAFAGVLIGTAAFSTTRLIETAKWNAHTYEVMQQSEKMLLSMVNIETGLRGFVASGNENFLEPFKKGREDFGKHWDEAKKLTSDNPSQQGRLVTMKEHHVQFLAVADALSTMRRDVVAGKTSLDTLLKEFSAGKDKAAMDAFRGVNADFSKAESVLLEERSAAMASTASLTITLLIAGGIGLCLGTALVGFALARSVLRQLGGEPASAAEVAERVARGDLSTPISLRSGDAASLMASLSRMQTSLGDVVSSVRQNSESVATASAQIAQGNQDLSQRTEQQASALEETAASMEELSSTVKQNADNARQANQLAANASTVAMQGGEVVGQVVETMKGINDSSKKIADIISVIDGIAFQTNILALNAAVEAARAGEQGRGFAVVASEVRSLAQRSADAAKEIKTLITASVERVEQGTALVDRAGETMTEVVSSIRRVTDIMGEISAASVEQSSGVSQVGEAVTQMDQATQQNAALVEQSAAAAESLKNQAEQLVQAVSIFRLSTNGSSWTPPAHAASAAQPHTPPPTRRPLATTGKPAVADAHSSSKSTPVERRSPDRAVNVVRPEFNAKSKPVAASSPTASAPAPAFESSAKTGSDDWETF